VEAAIGRIHNLREDPPMTGSLNNDLDGTPCAQASCFEVADTIATMRLELPVETGAPADDETILAVPLCIGHAHLLRLGAKLIDLNPGL
jgi:hypothetical protein